MSDECQFELIPETQADYRCRVCGLLVRNVPKLPIYATCGAAGRQPPTNNLNSQAERARKTCRHLGASSRLEDCRTCRGNVQVKVFACAVHTECTLGKPIEGLACCATCPDFQAAENESPAGGG